MVTLVTKRSAFVTAAKEDLRMKKMFRLLESGIYHKVDPDTLIKELETLHTSKSIHGLKFETIEASPKKYLTKAIQENQGFRSRAVAIKIDCYRTANLLQEHIESMVKYLTTKYNVQLSAEFKTAKDKSAAIDFLLEDFYELKKKLDTVLWVADQIVADLDKAGWSIANVIKLFELQARRE